MTSQIYARFPYQFTGRQLMVSQGWLTPLERLCEDIDTILCENKRGFHWTEIKQKYGGIRLYYEIEGFGDEAYEKVDKAIRAAELASETLCEVCGQPGRIEETNHWFDCLCEEHRQKRKSMATGAWRGIMKHEKLYEDTWCATREVR